jgi:hypothetical protein
MVLSIYGTEDPALPPLDERDNPSTCVSSLSFPLLPAHECLVDIGLCSESESRNNLVPESKKPLASAAVSIGEEVTEEREGIARPGYASNRRSQGGWRWQTLNNLPPSTCPERAEGWREGGELSCGNHLDSKGSRDECSVPLGTTIDV